MKKILAILVSFSCFLSSSLYADKIAIIGGGSSGMLSAWLLEQNHDITLYEAKPTIGGHVDTLQIEVNHAPVYLEGGAEFFSKSFYPHFLKLLRILHIPIHDYVGNIAFFKTDGSDLTILPPIKDGKIDWKKISPKNFFRMLQLLTVLTQGRAIYDTKNTSITLKEFADSLSITNEFKNDFLYPFLATFTGVSIEQAKSLPAYPSLLYLEENIDNNSQWYEVPNGLAQYLTVISNQLHHTRINLNDAVTAIQKDKSGYNVTDKKGETIHYDQLVFATDAEVTSKLLATVQDEKQLAQTIGQIHYFDTTIALHGDTRYMSPDPSDWSISNVAYDGKNSAMSLYKSWKSPVPIFKTWLTYDVHRAASKEGLPSPLYGLYKYRHPLPSPAFYNVPREVKMLQGRNHIWFANVWVNSDDSQESALNAAMQIAKQLSPDSTRLRSIANG